MRLNNALSGRRWRQSSTAGRMQEPLSYVSREMIASILENRSRRSISVCFTGHRRIASALLPLLTKQLDLQLRDLYQKGYRDFLCGGALGFDMLAAERVIHLQPECPDMRLIMVLPCSTQTRNWTDAQASRYERILYAADDTMVLSPTYYEGCMLARNRYMVDHCSLCLCFMVEPKGGTVSTVAYAAKQGMPIINLAMSMPQAVLRYDQDDAFDDYLD